MHGNSDSSSEDDESPWMGFKRHANEVYVSEKFILAFIWRLDGGEMSLETRGTPWAIAMVV